MEHSKVLPFLALILLCFSSCEKRDETPETRDPIYIDMNGQLAAVEKSLHEANLKILEGNNELKSAVPQTGQSKLAQRKVFQYENLKTVYEQQVKYWKIRINERAKQARLDYSKAFAAKEKWPKSEEYERYLSEKRLRIANIQWDAKNRLEEYKKSFPAPSKVAAPDHGGGH